MPISPAFRAAVQCDGKIKHSSEADARKAAASMKHSKKRRGKDRPLLNAYKCDLCGGYHLGRVDALRRRSERRRGAEPYTIEV